MRNVPTVLAVCLGLALLADAAHAQCTTSVEAGRVHASLKRAMRCSYKQLAGPGGACRTAPAPACAGELVSDTVALVAGLGERPPSADSRAAREQLRCQRRIGVASTRFVGVMLKQLIRGDALGNAEARARASLDTLPDQCLEGLSASGGGGLQAASSETSAVAAAGTFLDPNVLRDAIVAALAGMVVRSVPAPPAPRPNIVLIVTDDQRADTITPQLMPKLNAELVADGVLFEQGFVSDPLCCPSRASILTGRYAHNHGVLHNGRGDPLDPAGGVWAFSDVSTLATWLQEAGYRTGHFGKYLNGYGDFSREWAASHGGVHYVPPGWDRWYGSSSLPNLAGHYGISFIDEAGRQIDTDPGSCLAPTFAQPCPRQPDDCPHSTDHLRDEALRFIDEAVASGERFLLVLSPFSPHGPACPATRHRGARAGLSAHRPPSYDEGASGRDPDADKPEWFRRRARLTPAAIDTLRVRQLESLLSVDDAVGAIMQKLRETGQDANTLVVYLSDNGFLWGEHGRENKSCPYDECLRVPFVIRHPGLAPGPRTESAPVLNVDLAPTFATLAGLDPAALSPRPDGRSLLRLLDGSERAWRSDWLGEHWSETSQPHVLNPAFPTFALVRGPRWKYIEYCSGEIELYDLPSDPFELTNVASSHPEVVASQAARLRVLDPEWPAAIPFPCALIDQVED